MAIGMVLIGGGIVWATQVPAHGILVRPRRAVLRGRRRNRLRLHPGVDRRGSRGPRA